MRVIPLDRMLQERMARATTAHEHATEVLQKWPFLSRPSPSASSSRFQSPLAKRHTGELPALVLKINAGPIRKLWGCKTQQGPQLVVHMQKPKSICPLPSYLSLFCSRGCSGRCLSSDGTLRMARKLSRRHKYLPDLLLQTDLLGCKEFFVRV